MIHKTIRVLWSFLLIAVITFTTGDAISVNPVVTPTKLIPRETINITAPVKSYDELTNVLSDSLNSVCENLTLSLKNTNKWFNQQQFDKCFNLAVSRSVLTGPFYNGYKYSYTTGNTLFIKMDININYRFPRKTLLRYLSETENKAAWIINTVITPDMNDYLKEIALHDYIVNHACYDDINFQNNTVPNESYTPYGILIKGTGVCEGYAHTMKLLLNKAGVECILVYGKADGEEHAWNIVKIDNQYYHLDATWDDPAGVDRSTYYYFNLSDKMIAVNHNWDKDLYPQCTSTKHNYYRINDLWVENMTECQKRIENALANHEERINLKVSGSSPPSFKKALQSISAKMNFVGQYTYSYDEALGIMEIEFMYSE